jgi:hypothetical protein
MHVEREDRCQNGVSNISESLFIRNCKNLEIRAWHLRVGDLEMYLDVQQNGTKPPTNCVKTNNQ